MSAASDAATTPLTVLRGVGPARAARLGQLGLVHVLDLLTLVPLRMDWSTAALPVAAVLAGADRDAAAEAEVRVRGTLARPSLFRRGGRRSVLRTRLADATGKLEVLFFNQAWRRQELARLAEAGEEVELAGSLGRTKAGPALVAPAIGTPARPLVAPGTARPIYPTTAGVGQELLRGLVREALERFGELPDALDEHARAELALPERAAAVRALHVPETLEEHRAARRRMAFELCLGLQARVLAEAAVEGRARAVVTGDAERRALLARLPHAPTGAQRRVVGEVLDDLARTRPMRRLLQGDVGSGKTLVALAAAAAVAEHGGQVALLAPTEVLAEQHHRALAPVFARQGLTVVRLSSSLAPAARRAAHAALAAGTAQVAVGTHALFSRDVRFRRLDLAVVDEQQRFGVAHRQALFAKGRDVHALLMTATPIPRTLAQTLYADLDVSVLDEKPPGRGLVETRALAAGKRKGLVGWLAERLAEDERAFWICPRIEGEAGPEAAGSHAAEATFERLAAGPLAARGVELVHGRMDAEERERRLERFRRGQARCLVATTIVEVGVDVPEATVLVVEGAERFGLAQLHQLRGRVGRGARDAWCFLFGDSSARERLALLEATDDGFVIAEEDLRRRGMGDLFGLRQAGRNAEGLTGEDVDLELVRAARRMLAARPELLVLYGAADAGAGSEL